MSVESVAIGLAILGVVAIRIGVRSLGRYLERNFGRGKHPHLEGPGDRLLAPPRADPAIQRADPAPPLASAEPRRAEPSPFGREESGSPFGE